jgi:hypothetical protein
VQWFSFCTKNRPYGKKRREEDRGRGCIIESKCWISTIASKNIAYLMGERGEREKERQKKQGIGVGEGKCWICYFILHQECIILDWEREERTRGRTEILKKGVGVEERGSREERESDGGGEDKEERGEGERDERKGEERKRVADELIGYLLLLEDKEFLKKI